MLSDEEMIARLRFLYGDKRADAMAEAWSQLRNQGRGNEVDGQKERYCRRMYNITQFVKTLKERIAMRYNNGSYGSRKAERDAGRPRHAGHLFEGRFHSTIVEKTSEAYGAVASYIAVNPVKAHIADSVGGWRWSSFACAVNGDGPRARRCQRAYAEMFGCSWEEARAKMERLTSDRLPEDFETEGSGFFRKVTDEDGHVRHEPLRVTQAIWLKVRAFTQGAVVSRNTVFAQEVFEAHPKRFPHDGGWSVDFCRRLNWAAA